MKHKHLAFAAFFLLPALASCGQTALTNTSTANLVSGTIQAMSADRSSITVAGQSIKLSNVGAASVGGLSAKAYYGSKKVRVNGKDSSTKALSVGQKVKVYVAGGEATDIDVDLELRGAVVSVDAAAGSLVVAGKTVTVSGSTRFDLGGGDDSAATGAGSLADIKAGDFIEVTGTTDATTGVVAATKIEVRTAKEIKDGVVDGHTEFRGTVSGFVTGGTSFKLKSVTVNCTGACVLPAGLADGSSVEVDGVLEADGSLTASRVSLHASGGHGEGHHQGEAAPALGSSVVLQDEIAGLNETSNSFKLDGFTVDYKGLTVAGLANNVHVKVAGTVDASDAWLVHASSVTVLAAGVDDHGGEGPGGGTGGGPGKR